MKRKNIRAILLIGVFIAILQFSSGLSPVNPQTMAAVAVKTAIEDIRAVGFPSEFLKPGSKAKDSEYIREYNMAVDDYNAAKFFSALPILKKLIIGYRDNRPPLYLWAVCMGEALSEKEDYSQAIAYYKAALTIQKEAFVEHNIVYCYLQLSKRLQKADQVAMLLYGYQFIAGTHLHDDSLETLAVNLGNDLFSPPLVEYFPAAIECLKAALAQNDNPYLHQTLGLIYRYQNCPSLAKVEFKKVVNDYPNSPFYAKCLECYNNIGNVHYRYQTVCPIKVTAGRRGAASVTAEIMLQFPQSYRYQTVKNLQVDLNHQPIRYQVVTDRFGTQFLYFKIRKRFLPGKNELVVNAQVDVADKQLSKDSLASFRVADYRKNEAQYKLWTQSTETTDLKNPSIQKMVAEIRKNVKGDHLIDLVQGVYQYVIAAFSYQNTPGTAEKVGVERALRHMRSADCEDYAVITVALLRALKIPAGYFSGEYYGSQVGHAWAVFFTPDYQPIPLDTTWGDTSKMPDLFFLASSNSLVTTSFSCDSNLMSNTSSIHMQSKADPGVTVEIEAEKLQLDREVQ